MALSVTLMRHLFRRFWVRWGLVPCLVLLIVLEVSIRCSGYGDFPVFAVDREIGYVAKPSQSGIFLGGKDWVLNERSMLNGVSFKEDPKNGVLVLGDSIVWGGLAYKHHEKLGPQLQKSLGEPWKVWSSGAGSWALLNELTWLERNPDVVNGVSRIVWIVNDGDFGLRSQWASDLTHPRHPPVWLTGYLGVKFLNGRGWWPFTEPPAAVVPDLNPEKELAAFCERIRVSGGPEIILVWYPNRDALVDSSESTALAAVHRLAQTPGLRFYDLRSTSGWDATAYKDSIHPSIDGNRRLSLILREWILAE
jgi:lysophospholipase L1-like esterase